MHIFIKSSINNLENNIDLTIFNVLNYQNRFTLHFKNNKYYHIICEIIQDNNRFIFNYLNNYKYYEQLQEGFDDFICTLFNYNLSYVYGFTVKDKNENKLKPYIPILIHNKFWYIIPNKLKYIKGSFNIPYAIQLRIINISIILQSVLNHKVLCFINNNRIYKLLQNNNNYYLEIEQPEFTPSYLTLQYITKSIQKNKAITILGKINSNLTTDGLSMFLVELWNKINKNERLKAEEIKVLNQFINEVPTGHQKIDEFIAVAQQYLLKNNICITTFGKNNIFKENCMCNRKASNSLIDFIYKNIKF